MELRRNSFFFRHYLGYREEWNFPNTVCQVIWRFIWRTLVFIYGLIMLVSPLTTYLSFGTILAEGPQYTEKFGNFFGFILGSASALFSTLLLCAMVLGGVVGLVLLAGLVYEKSAKVQKSSNVVAGMVGGAYNRIKNKTCNLVTIKDDDEHKS